MGWGGGGGGRGAKKKWKIMFYIQVHITKKNSIVTSYFKKYAFIIIKKKNLPVKVWKWGTKIFWFGFPRFCKQTFFFQRKKADFLKWLVTIESPIYSMTIFNPKKAAISLFYVFYFFVCVK